MNDSLAQIEAYFKGLGDASRLRILNLLLYGELCGCDVQYALQMTQSNVSRHLAYLKHAGLAKDRREGFRVFYRLADSANGELKPLFEFLRTAFTDDRIFQNDLVRLKRAIKEGACRMRQIRALPRLAGRERVAGRDTARLSRRV